MKMPPMMASRSRCTRLTTFFISRNTPAPIAGPISRRRRAGHDQDIAGRGPVIASGEMKR
jgi:hypothetical protein